MGKINRRRMKIAAAATILFAWPFAVSSVVAVAPAVAKAPSSSGDAADLVLGGRFDGNDDTPLPLSTVFSCGSHWTKAKTCATLCPTGDDDACPPGQYCYGGIPCDTDMLERQRRMERDEMDRLKKVRGEQYVDRFVCGSSYEQAEESCNNFPSIASLVNADVSVVGGAHYCPAGSSSQCPSGMECYAAVSCARPNDNAAATEVKEGASSSLRQMLWNSFMSTEPILANSTPTSMVAAPNGSGQDCLTVDQDGHGLIGEWISSFGDYSSSTYLGKRFSTMLSSSRYGLNQGSN